MDLILCIFLFLLPVLEYHHHEFFLFFFASWFLFELIVDNPGEEAIINSLVCVCMN